MRYLVIFIVVLAVAATAWSICDTDNQFLGPYDDSELPQSSDTYSVTDCDSLDWTWKFTRTTQAVPSVTLTLEIVGTPWSATFLSGAYLPGVYSNNGSTNITSSPNQLKMSKIGMGSGCFDSIKLSATNYE